MMDFFKLWKRNSALKEVNRKLKEANRKIKKIIEESNWWENKYYKVLMESSDLEWKYGYLEKDNERYKETIKTLEGRLLKYSTYVNAHIKKESDGLPDVESL